MAAMLTGIARGSSSTTRRCARVGSVQMALMSGVLTQWLTDPATAPVTPEEIVAGIRRARRGQAFTSMSSRVSASSCGSTLVRPITGMKLRVAAPPRHHVLVQVGGDAGAGHRALVHARG